MKNHLLVLFALLLLTACALTPEERYARMKAQIKAQREREIVMTAQCDPALADIMRASDVARDTDDKDEWQRLQEQYRLRSEEPLVQKCLALARENEDNKLRASNARGRANFYRSMSRPLFPPPFRW